MKEHLFRRANWALLALIIVVALMLVAPDIAQAAPGGLIKAAARSTFGKIVFGALFVIFAPLIAYYMARSAVNSARTRKDLARLAQTYPQYRWLDAKDRATEVFNWVWSAWSQGKMSLADQYATPWYWQNQQLQLDQWARDGVENVCRVQKINSIRPLFVQHNAQNGGEGSRLVVSISASVVDYLANSATGQVVQGDTKPGDLESVWTFKWEGGAWRLNLIEADAKEYDYLFAPNEVPQTVPAPQRI